MCPSCRRQLEGGEPGGPAGCGRNAGQAQQHLVAAGGGWRVAGALAELVDEVAWEPGGGERVDQDSLDTAL
jgi:hypothetical protein